MARGKRQTVGARRHIRLAIRAMKKEIKCTENLIKAVNDFGTNCVEGKILSSKGAAIPIGVSILHLSLPDVLYQEKILLNKFKRRLK